MSATVHQLRPTAPASIEDVTLNLTPVAPVILMAATILASTPRDDDNPETVRALADAEARLETWEALTGYDRREALDYAQRVTAHRNEVVAFVTPLPANTGNPCDGGM